MSKYLITWVEENICGVMIEADSKSEALDKFGASEYDMEDVQNMHYLGFQDNSIVVEQI
jgi:hypothetical protein